MESPAMPLAVMHRDGTLDLLSMAGILSFNSFGIFKPRFTVKWLDKTAASPPFRHPATTSPSSSKAASQSPDLRARVRAERP
jgi:hypothetical protein